MRSVIAKAFADKTLETTDWANLSLAAYVSVNRPSHSDVYIASSLGGPSPSGILKRKQ